jgi:hypothetical protein
VTLFWLLKYKNKKSQSENLRKPLREANSDVMKPFLFFPEYR